MSWSGASNDSEYAEYTNIPERISAKIQEVM